MAEDFRAWFLGSAAGINFTSENPGRKRGAVQSSFSMADAAKKKGGLKLGAKVWIRDVDVQNPEVFVMGTLKGLAGKIGQIETAKGEQVETDLFYPANPPDVDHSDHTGLLYLSDAALLYNTKVRYAKDDIYTFVGPILVSVSG